MKTVTATKEMKSLQSDAEKIRNDETATVGTMSVGDVVRQGDIYVVCIERLPAKKTPTKNRQLAPGTSQGSRHCVAGDVSVYEGDKEQVADLIRKAIAPKSIELHEALIGPVFESKEQIEIDHPEHGNRIVPAGCYAVVYQRLHGEEVKRQQD